MDSEDIQANGEGEGALRAQPTAEQEDTLKAGLFVRSYALPPYQGVHRFRQQYVLKEKLYFSVSGELYPIKRIYRAIYILMPVWGHEHDFPSRVIGYQVQENGSEVPGALRDFACLENDSIKVKFAESPSGL